MVISSLLAASPLLLLLALMLVGGWSAARAAAVALGLAFCLALGVFAGGAALQRLPGVLAESLFQGVSILWILLPALALYLHQRDAGTFDRLREALGRLAPSRGLQMLLFGWFLALFLEGAAGFGTPAAIVAPLLVALGAAPVQAVVIALTGHAAGVVFGALGTPVFAQVGATGLSAGTLAPPTSLLNAAAAAVLMLALVRALTLPPSATSGSAPPWRWAAFALLVFVLPQIWLAHSLGPELATLGAAAVGLATTLLALRIGGPARSAGAADTHAATPDTANVLRALAPYLALLILVVSTRALPGVRDIALAIEWNWSLDGGFSGRLVPLQHPGTLLLVALIVGSLAQGRGIAPVGSALRASARRLLPVALALLAMLALSRLMLHAGLVAALQAGLVAGLGSAWPWMAPGLGALGSFVTGSATASNLLFASLQADTAKALGLSPAWMLAGQGVGAAVGNLICPHNVVAAAATVGLGGREALILRRVLPVCLGVLLVTGTLLAALI